MKIFIAGHRGMVGSSIVRALDNANASSQKLNQNEMEIIVADRSVLDLEDDSAVKRFFDKHMPDQVYLAAAKVGGIKANNDNPADFLMKNLKIQTNVIQAAYLSGVAKLLFLGSSCIFPKHASQPIREESLLTGPLEPTNESYALAKISGIKLCNGFNKQYGTDFRAVMPCNLYGLGDNYKHDDAHVIPALLRRFHEAKEDENKEVVIWGTGSPLREFLYTDDLADACVFLMEMEKESFHKVALEAGGFINIGSGVEISILELSKLIGKVVGFEGCVRQDPSKPDGTPRKLMDGSRLKSLGWNAATNLESGLEKAYDDFKQGLKQTRNLRT